ncbi:MAG: helix-turn-helix transcriptional regulator [Acidobacteria bacterium]|nr:helix-turn-helix transcriptional regulator [Acidobacteriota bacterium]
MPYQKGQRLKKYSREAPENLPPRRITPRSIEIIDIIRRYRVIPTSQIVRLVDGDIRTTERHLQNLYHQGLVNRFAFPSSFYATEFNYYLDDARSLALITNAGYEIDKLDSEMVRRNREKQYSEITMGKQMLKMQGRLLHMHHELMISRFHYMLEKACLKSGDKVKLLGFYQGSQLWNDIEVRKVTVNSVGTLTKTDETEILPHRPDAFFALHFPDRKPNHQTHYYLYEADRKTTSIKKMQKKFRSHFHYIVKQKKHVDDYRVKRIKAVLVESIDNHWTNNLRLAARHPIVSGSKPSPLFWFTTSDVIFEKPLNVTIKSAQKEVPVYLEKPELVFAKIWATPNDSDEQPALQSLIH